MDIIFIYPLYNSIEQNLRDTFHIIDRDLTLLIYIRISEVLVL